MPSSHATVMTVPAIGHRTRSGADDVSHEVPNRSSVSDPVRNVGGVAALRPDEAMGQLAAAVDLVAAIDPSELSSAEAYGELLEELTRQARRLDHESHRLLRGFDARGDAQVLGYHNAGQWCRARLRISSRRRTAD